MWRQIPIELACKHYIVANRSYNRRTQLGKRITVNLPDFENVRACLNVKYNKNTGNIAFAHGLRIGKRIEIYPTTHQPRRCNTEHGRQVIYKRRQRSKVRHIKERKRLKERGYWRQHFSTPVDYHVQIIDRLTIMKDSGEIIIESYFRRRPYG